MSQAIHWNHGDGMWICRQAQIRSLSRNWRVFPNSQTLHEQATRAFAASLYAILAEGSFPDALLQK